MRIPMHEVPTTLNYCIFCGAEIPDPADYDNHIRTCSSRPANLKEHPINDCSHTSNKGSKYSRNARMRRHFKVHRDVSEKLLTEILKDIVEARKPASEGPDTVPVETAVEPAGFIPSEWDKLNSLKVAK